MVRYLLVLLFNKFITLHYCSVAILNGKEILVFHIHILSQFGIGSSSKKTMDNMHHLSIILILAFINIHHLTIMFVFPRLVKYAQKNLKPVVHIAMQTGYLDDYAIMDKTIDEWIGQAYSDLLPVIII